MDVDGADQHATGIMFGSHTPTIWVDARTGQGVDDQGAPVHVRVGGRRRKPNILDLIEGALEYRARRVMLTGRVRVPTIGARHWLYTRTPGWTSLGHKASVPITARFQHDETKTRVEVRTAEEWFGNLPLNPAQAREAWDLTETVVQSIEPRQHLLYTPSRTGLSLWWVCLPRDKKTRRLIIPPKVSRDIDDDLNNVRGQHHTEHLVAGPSRTTHPDCVPLIDPTRTPRIDRFTYVDGKFMYGSLGRELGIGPGRRLNRAAAFEMLNDRDGMYERAVYEIRFTVPEDWHHIGIFGVKHENRDEGWFYPNRPGARHITWAEASEIYVALANGWLVEPLQAIVFRRARPMDNYMSAIDRKRDEIEHRQDLSVMLRRAVVASLRAILIQSIGGLASRGASKTITTDSAFSIPAEYRHTVVRHGDVFTYQVPGDRWDSVNYHPELAVQIWGRGRSKLLNAPSALGNGTAGALHVPADSLIGVNGDAVYTTEIPRWALPARFGGGDDGRIGRLRIKGILDTPHTTPVLLARRDALRTQSEKAGPRAAWAGLEPVG